MQMSHALDVAKRFGVPKIYFDIKVQEPGVFQERKACLVDDVEMYATPYAVPTEHESVLYGTFWSLQTSPQPAVPSSRETSCHPAT